MKIAAMGVVFAGGAGVGRLQAALREAEPPKPRMLERESIPVLALPPEALLGNPVLAPARRADRFCKMALLAGMEAWQGCAADPRRTGIILATALGPHATVFRYIGEMLDFGGEKASPTLFSQSVHAAAASMIATSAGLHGPVLTLSDLASPFTGALSLAGAWLAGGRCDAVLVAAVDELSDVLAHVVRRKWRAADAGRQADPAQDDAMRGTVPGEGAVCFRLEREGSLRVAAEAVSQPGAVCRLIDRDALGAMPPKPGLAAGDGGIPHLCLTPYWGSLRIGAAFNLAAAALMLREQRLYTGNGTPPEPPAGTRPWREARIEIVPACGGGRVITLQHDAGKRSTHVHE